MMTQKKKQNRVLYASLILLIVAASLLIAVATGASRRNKPQTLPETTEESETERDLPLTTILDKITEPQAERPLETPPETTKEAAVTEPAVLTVADIEFSLPAKGEVLVPCSLDTPMYSITMEDYRTHSGIDITAEVGDSVMSCADGVVTEIFDDPMMGKTVKISHSAGAVSVYKNLAPELMEGIEVGAEVTAGQVIGAVGDTALIECEEEPHLHFELMVDGEHVDPCEHIDIVSVNEIYED